MFKCEYKVILECDDVSKIGAFARAIDSVG